MLRKLVNYDFGEFESFMRPLLKYFDDSGLTFVTILLLIFCFVSDMNLTY